MSTTPEVRRSASQNTSGESTLYRLAQLAADFGADQISANARAIADRVAEGRFYVACVGQFKRGKSTLLNAIVGESVLPAGVVPVTSVPTVLRYGVDLSARVRFKGGQWTSIPISAVENYVSEEKNPENVLDVEGLEVFVPSPLLATGMCLVDTPGLGSIHAGNTAATQAFIPHVDAAIVAIGSDPPLSGDELDLVGAVAQQIQDVLFVLNKADRVTEAERSMAIEFARQAIAKRIGRNAPEILQVSALERFERRGPERDWPKLLKSLETLVQQSGKSLVREATERGVRRAAEQLLAVIGEERSALQRPVEESQQRIVRLHKTVEDAEYAMKDLGVLLSAEQQRISEILKERRGVFLKRSQLDARKELSIRLNALAPRRKGPSYRRDVNHLAQEIARTQLTPWLEGEAAFAEDAFRKTARHFVELGNDFLNRLAESGIPELARLPHALDPEQGLRARSDFHFHVIERVAAPASPFLYVADLASGALGLRAHIDRDAQDFLDQILDVNSARVQSDVDDRLRESRRKLEGEIKSLLREATAVAERALGRARIAQAAGASAVQAAIERLETSEAEVHSLYPARSGCSTRI